MKKKIIGIMLIVLMCFSTVLFGCETPGEVTPEKEYSKEEMLEAVDKAEKLTSFYLNIGMTFMASGELLTREMCLSVIGEKESIYAEYATVEGESIDTSYIDNKFRYYTDGGKKYKDELSDSDHASNKDYLNVKAQLQVCGLENIKDATAVWTRKSNNVFTIDYSKKWENNTEVVTYEITATAGLLSKLVGMQKYDDREESMTMTATISATPKEKKTDFSEYKLFDLTKADVVAALSKTKLSKNYRLDVDIEGGSLKLQARCMVMRLDSENYYWESEQNVDGESWQEWYTAGYYYMEKNDSKVKKPMTESAAKGYMSIKGLIEEQLEESNFTNDTSVWTKKSKYVYEVTSTTSEIYSKAKYTVGNGIISNIELTAKDGGSYRVQIYAYGDDAAYERKTDFSDFVLTDF